MAGHRVHRLPGNCFTLTPVLKVRVFGTRKWTIDSEGLEKKASQELDKTRLAELRALLNELTVQESMMLSRNSLFRQQADGFIDARQPDVEVLHPWAVIIPKFSEKRLYWTKDT